MPDGGADNNEPTVTEVRRYYTRQMSVEERLAFERRAGSSPEFLRRAREIGEILSALQSVQVRIDTEAVAALTQPSGWPERLKTAVQQLRDKGYELSTLAEKGAEVAIELTLQAVEGPVQACLWGGANLRFSYVPLPVLTRGASRTRGAGKAPKRAAIFGTNSIKHARINVDPSARRVSIHFPDPPLPSDIMLTPEDPAHSPLIGARDPKSRGVIFENVPEGRYLLTIPPPHKDAETQRHKRRD